MLLSPPKQFGAARAEAPAPTVPQRKATICQLVHSLDVGGAEMLASRISRRLSDQFRFVFVCLDSSGPLGEKLKSDGWTVRVVGRNSGVDVKCPLRLARILRELDVDIIHAHQYTPFFYGMTSRLCGSRRPILFTEHGRHQPDFPRRKRILANRMLLSRRDRIIAVGQTVKDALVNNEGLPADRIVVLYNGIDVEAFSTATDRIRARSIFNARPHDFVVVEVARLDYLKDHLTAVRALAQASSSYSNIRLVLIGDGPERAAIEAEARVSGVADRVQFLGTRQDVDQLLCGADLFLLTSVSEGIPLTVLEAMAAGLPVVATSVGGLPEIVVDEKTGFLTPAKDVPALADRIHRFISDPELGRRFGDAGRVRARELFDESRMCSEYASHYEALAVV